MRKLTPLVLAAGLALAGCGAGSDADQEGSDDSGRPIVTQTRTTSAKPKEKPAKPSLPPNVKTGSQRSGGAGSGGGSAGNGSSGNSAGSGGSDGSSGGSGSSSPSCGNTTAEQEIIRNLGKIQPTRWDWDPGYIISEGYDPCATLSWSIVTVHDATASSARQIVLFNHGEYIGTATAEAYGFLPTVTRADDHTINVIYHYSKPGEGVADASGEAHASFTWNEATQSVDMAGNVPPT